MLRIFDDLNQIQQENADIREDLTNLQSKLMTNNKSTGKSTGESSPPSEKQKSGIDEKEFIEHLQQMIKLLRRKNELQEDENRQLHRSNTLLENEKDLLKNSLYQLARKYGEDINFSIIPPSEESPESEATANYNSGGRIIASTPKDTSWNENANIANNETVTHPDQNAFSIPANSLQKLINYRQQLSDLYERLENLIHEELELINAKNTSNK